MDLSLRLSLMLSGCSGDYSFIVEELLSSGSVKLSLDNLLFYRFIFYFDKSSKREYLFDDYLDKRGNFL